MCNAPSNCIDRLKLNEDIRRLLREIVILKSKMYPTLAFLSRTQLSLKYTDRQISITGM